MERIGVAMRQFQQEAVAIDGREAAEQVGVIETMLIQANGLDAFGRQHPFLAGEQSEAALVLEIKVDGGEAAIIIPVYINMFKLASQFF